MRKLATELLDLSRLESGALELRPEPTDVGQLAREVAGEFTPAAAQHEPTSSCDLRPRADRARLRPRAGRPGPADPARQRARATRRRAPESWFRPRATTGTCGWRSPTPGLGIKRQTMPHIFEPFFTSKDGARGAGLGLAIARELAEQMHGELTRALACPGGRRSRWRCPHEPRLAAGLRVGLAAAVVAGCGLGGGTTTASSVADDDRPASRSSSARAPGEALRRRRRSTSDEAPGVVTVVSLFGGSDARRAAASGGVGSGFVLNGDGEIATNAHVVTTGRGPDLEQAREVYVEFADGNRVAAEDRAATTRTPTSRCSRSTRRA